VDREQAVEVRQPFLGEHVQRERHARRLADPACALAQVGEVLVDVLARRRPEDLGWKPEGPFGLVHDHEFVHDGLEVGDDFDLREGFAIFDVHRALGDGMTDITGTDAARRCRVRGALATSAPGVGPAGDLRPWWPSPCPCACGGGQRRP
jgi:hypothetical protein